MSKSPSPAELQKYLTAASSAADGASRILLNYYGNLRNVSEKFHANLVSEADRESEAFIKDHLLKLFPEHRVLGEESGLSDAPNSQEKTTGVSTWIIDPLDGTTNYVHQFPIFGISIGLEIDGELVVGLVDAPKLEMRWQAVRGGGAFFNGEKISVSTRASFSEGLFATGFSSLDDTLDTQFRLLEDCIKDARGIRRAGAAALDLCFVAQGIFDVFWEKNLQAWDTAAGTVIAREAGAVVTNFEGKTFTSAERNIVCGQPALHAEILSRMQKTFSTKK